MNYRIKEYKKGFVVEVLKKTWYGMEYWVHFIHYSGISSEPYFHSNYEYAETNLLNEIKWETLRNSNR